MPISAFSPADPEQQRLPNKRPVPRAILTRADERAIRADLERLRAEAGGELVERLREAREFGGTKENDEYLQIQEEEAVLASRIHRLESLLEVAEIVESEAGPADVVALGTVAEVRNLTSGAVREHRLTGGFALDGAADVSVNSPVGQALLGASPGDRVAVDLPNGRSVELEVLSVRHDSPTARPGPA